MWIQYLIIALLFAGAVWYVGRIFWRAWFSKDQAACAKGCGGACSVIDVDRLQRTIELAEAREGAKA
ncbi:FeoB-associated Cys-rich membrane protein [Hymenobacter metallilatus]|uniref:FeoB-associated Cys-rich membrane protein n=1 Tax=Hymenobacter metallilatus TaxID=2493666 RepID=UPI001639F813|nr:FeoB-associated Cys-rich membrane protein [Hymenobacter metallilatus]